MTFDNVNATVAFDFTTPDELAVAHVHSLLLHRVVAPPTTQRVT